MYYNCVTANKNNNLTQAELMNQIQSYAFAINDLTLYLDTHPGDKKALALHNQYCQEYRDVFEDYQRRFGPLSIFCPCNSWRWIASPWPWEGGVE